MIEAHFEETVMAILKPKGGDKKQLSVRIESSVMDALEAVEKRIQEEAPNDALDRAEVIENALRAAVKAANAELDARKKAAAKADAT